MGEKRFTINPSTIVDDCFVIIDNEKKYAFPTLESTLNYMFCKALNELHEENEQLKSENKGLQGKASSWKITASEQIMEQSKLMKENVQLRKENHTLKQLLEDNITRRVEINEVCKERWG